MDKELQIPPFAILRVVAWNDYANSDPMYDVAKAREKIFEFTDRVAAAITIRENDIFINQDFLDFKNQTPLLFSYDDGTIKTQVKSPDHVILAKMFKVASVQFDREMVGEAVVYNDKMSVRLTKEIGQEVLRE